jgi:hypothetical protein
MSTSVRPSTAHIPGYPVSTVIWDNYNLPGTFQKSHPNAPPGQAVNLFPPTITTEFANAYQPRYGKIKYTGGTNKFGGTMRTIQHVVASGLANAVAGYYAWVLQPPSPTKTPTGPQQLGENWHIYDGTWVHTSLPTSFQIKSFRTGLGPWTTGMATNMMPAGTSVTSFYETGYDNRTTTSWVNGTLSMVAPGLGQLFFIPSGGSPLFSTGFGFMDKLTMTFLPEPDGVVMLGCGLVALAGLAHLRRR